jgi:hypothetical protein
MSPRTFTTSRPTNTRRGHLGDHIEGEGQPLVNEVFGAALRGVRFVVGGVLFLAGGAALVMVLLWDPSRENAQPKQKTASTVAPSTMPAAAPSVTAREAVVIPSTPPQVSPLDTPRVTVEPTPTDPSPIAVTSSQWVRCGGRSLCAFPVEVWDEGADRRAKFAGSGQSYGVLRACDMNRKCELTNNTRKARWCVDPATDSAWRADDGNCS